MKLLAETGSIIGVELLGHVIVWADSFVSLKEKGYI
ncbi:hypothetical protein EXW31_28735 (plasmid) [Bacillus mycoides]|nr:hypothetical protein EXW31_28735 [Bacillus mycoides]